MLAKYLFKKQSKLGEFQDWIHIQLGMNCTWDDDKLAYLYLKL